MQSLNQKILNHFKTNHLIYIIILVIIVLSLPYALRIINHNTYLIGSPSYYHLNEAEKSVRIYQNPYHFFLSLNYLGNRIIYFIFQLVIAIGSLILLARLLKKIELDEDIKIIYLLILILSPALIYTFTIFNHYSFFILLNLIGFNLLITKQKWSKYLSLFFFCLIPFLDLSSGLLTIMLLVYYYYHHREDLTKQVIAFVIISLILNTYLRKPFFLGPYETQNWVWSLSSDMGSLLGFSFFTLILIIMGIVYRSKKEVFWHLVFALIFLFTIYRNAHWIYLNLIITLWAAYGLNYLLKKEWKLKWIQKVTIFLVVLGLIFSSISSINKISMLPPDPQIVDSLNYIKITQPNQTIFSPPQDSYLIEYFTPNRAFVHYHDGDFSKKDEESNLILQSAYIEKTFPILEANNLSIIYLSKNVLSEMPKEQGILFIFKNERFKMIYDKNETEIWRFK